MEVALEEISSVTVNAIAPTARTKPAAAHLHFQNIMIILGIPGLSRKNQKKLILARSLTVASDFASRSRCVAMEGLSVRTF